MRTAQRALPAVLVASAVLALVFLEAGRVSARLAVGRQEQQGASGGGPIPVLVDATQPWTGEQKDLVETCGIASEASAAWAGLVPASAERVPATFDPAAVRVHASRSPDGLLVVLTNLSDRKVEVKLTLQVSPGAYSFEKVTLSTEKVEAPPALVRLQSCIVGSQRRTDKPVWLAPRTGDAIWVTNRSAQVQRTAADLRAAVAALSGADPRAYRRVMPALRECGSYVSAASASGTGRTQLARNAHRALLQLALVQAFARNATGEQRTEAPDAGSVSARCEALEAALAEVSAAALGVVVDARAEVRPDGTIHQEIEVSNTGDARVSSVKVWPSGPAGASVRPSEPKLFGALTPGRSVRAAFDVRLPAAASPGSLVAHVSYRYGSGPAHLRLQALRLSPAN